MSALAETLGPLAEVFEELGLRWYLFGAQAVAIRGAPRATQDVDVTVEIARRDLTRLVASLEARGLRHRFPERAEELIAQGAVLPLASPAGMEVDLVLAGSGLEQLALARATFEEVEGLRIPVAHPTDLAVMKVLAGRGKDLDDVRSLLAGGQVDIGMVRDLLQQLEQALGQSDLVPVWERLIAE